MVAFCAALVVIAIATEFFFDLDRCSCRTSCRTTNLPSSALRPACSRSSPSAFQRSMRHPARDSPPHMPAPTDRSCSARSRRCECGSLASVLALFGHPSRRPLLPAFRCPISPRDICRPRSWCWPWWSAPPSGRAPGAVAEGASLRDPARHRIGARRPDRAQPRRSVPDAWPRGRGTCSACRAIALVCRHVADGAKSSPGWMSRSRPGSARAC